MSAEVIEPPSPVGARYVEPSAERILETGEKVGRLFARNLTSEFVLQRLTDRTYWVQRYYYGTTFYAGEEGVLLFDPLAGHGEALLAAIATVTDKPVTAMVYSHDHADHIADASVIVDRYPDVRIIASEATGDKMAYLQSAIPPATDTVEWPNGTFVFENLQVQLHGFTRAAHSDDHSAWLLADERVLHAPDLINGDQIPFWHFAGSENFVYLAGNLQQTLDLDWRWLNGGHGNIAERADIDFTLDVLDDYRNAVAKAMADNQFAAFIDPSDTNAHTTFMVNWIDATVKQATDALRPKYGKFYGYDAAAPSNLQMVLHTLLSYQ